MDTVCPKIATCMVVIQGGPGRKLPQHSHASPTTTRIKNTKNFSGDAGVHVGVPRSRPDTAQLEEFHVSQRIDSGLF